MMPPDRYCRECGGELEIRNLQRRPVEGFIGPRQWQADFRCKKCGAESGTGWSTLRTSRGLGGLLRRLTYRLGSGTRFAAIQRSRPNRAWIRQDGRVDVAIFVASAPFPVYGLKGRPVGLCPRSLGASASGDPEVLTRLHLGYTRGPQSAPAASMSVRVGRGHRGSGEPFSEVHSILWNCTTREQRARWRREGDFHREWNMEVWRRGTSTRAPLEISGVPVELDLTRWEHLDVVMARFSIDDVQVSATSARLSPDEMLLALRSLVDLRADREAQEDHQRGHEEARAESMRRPSGQ